MPRDFDLRVEASKIKSKRYKLGSKNLKSTKYELVMTR